MTAAGADGWRGWLTAFLLSVGVVAGSGYTMYVHYDFEHSTDTRSYLQMARGEFAGVLVTHRYRVPVPFLAAAVAQPLEAIYARLWPHRPQRDWPLRMAFYGVNAALMGVVGALLFHLCRHHGATPGAAALGVAAVLTSRWAVYLTGLPLVDSLYLLVVVLAFYGARTGSAMALTACILLGPHAKESFLLLVPWILLYGRRALAPPPMVALLGLAAALTLGVRHWIDGLAGAQGMEGVTNALDHVANMGYAVTRLLSFRGAGEIFSIFGFFLLLPVAGLAGGIAARRHWLQAVGADGLWLLAIVAAHMLLSGDLARMGYLSAPVFALACSLILTTHPRFQWLGAGVASPETAPPPGESAP